METIPYSQFKQYLINGSIRQLDHQARRKISAEPLKEKKKSRGRSFNTIRVNDPDLVKDLDEKKVSYSGYIESKFLTGLLSWILLSAFFF